MWHRCTSDYSGATSTHLGDFEVDGDVAAGGLGVRAHLVRGLRQLLRLRTVHVRQVDHERYRQREGLAFRPDAYPGCHGRPVHIGLRPAPHKLQRTVEARRVAGGEELLGVAALPRAAHLGREREVKVNPLVGRGDMTVAATTGGHGLGGVEDLVRAGHSWISLGSLRHSTTAPAHRNSPLPPAVNRSSRDAAAQLSAPYIVWMPR